MADGVDIEQALGGVCMSAIACIDDMHMGRHMFRDQIRRAGLAVSHHKNIRGHGTQIGDGVKQTLTLAG